MLNQQEEQPKDIEDESEAPDFESLVSFFDLLISVDKRINPESYD
jgi:hypothetical protein